MMQCSRCEATAVLKDGLCRECQVWLAVQSAIENEVDTMRENKLLTGMHDADRDLMLSRVWNNAAVYADQYKVPFLAFRAAIPVCTASVQSKKKVR